MKKLLVSVTDSRRYTYLKILILAHTSKQLIIPFLVFAVVLFFEVLYTCKNK